MSEAPRTFPGDCLDSGRIVFDLPEQVTAYCRARFAGRRVEVEIRERKSKRSLQANAAFHACLGRWYDDKQLTGTAKAAWVEQTKDDLLALQFGYVVRQNQFTGEVIKSLVQPHTSALDVAQFSELWELAAVEAAKNGHVMVMPDEYKALKRAAQRQAAKQSAA